MNDKTLSNAEILVGEAIISATSERPEKPNRYEQIMSLFDNCLDLMDGETISKNIFVRSNLSSDGAYYPIGNSNAVDSNIFNLPALKEVRRFYSSLLALLKSALYQPMFELELGSTSNLDQSLGFPEPVELFLEKETGLIGVYFVEDDNQKANIEYYQKQLDKLIEASVIITRRAKQRIDWLESTAPIDFDNPGFDRHAFLKDDNQ